MANKDISMHTTEAEIKGIARSVGASLKRAGHGVPHSVLLHALAGALDRRDWHTLKAAVAARQAPAPAARTADVEFAPRTLFWLKLAHLLGRPVNPLPADNDEALTAARALVGPALDGVLLWEGWTIPATLDVVTSSVDAQDLRPSAAAAVGSLTLQMDGKSFSIEAGFTSEKGWYLSAGGVARFTDQVNRSVRDEDVLTPRAPDCNPGELEVKASFWTDDRSYEVSFNAAPYFSQASVDKLLSIAEVGFVGDSCTDRVAEYMADRRLNEDLVEAFEYLGALSKARLREPVGFECRIDDEDFYRWMDMRHRSEFAQWLCVRAGVRLTEAQEDEVRGLWDWVDDAGNACECSLATQEEAALDAYETLGLLEQAIAGEL